MTPNDKAGIALDKLSKLKITHSFKRRYHSLIDLRGRVFFEKKKKMKTISLLELKLILHGRIEKHGGIRPAARALGIDASHLCQALKPGTEPIASIVGAIGYRKAETRYEKAS